MTFAVTRLYSVVNGRIYERGTVSGMKIGRGNRYSEETHPNVTFSVINLTSPDAGSSQ